jgi:hypothetical protein
MCWTVLEEKGVIEKVKFIEAIKKTLGESDCSDALL